MFWQRRARLVSGKVSGAALPVCFTVALNMAWFSPSVSAPAAGPLNATYGTGEHSPQHPSVAQAELQIRQLQQLLQKNPRDERSRMSLVGTFEALAGYHERKHNALDAWRYYGAASRALQASANAKSYRPRIEYDDKRAAINRELRSDFLHKTKRVGFVYTSFQWLDYPKLDKREALHYTSAVNTLIRDSWSDSQKSSSGTRGGKLPKILTVNFTMMGNGSIRDLKLVESCGLPLIDAAALQAIRDVPKFPPLLPPMGKSVPFQAQFMK